MSHPWVHSQSSVKRFGGQPDDYLMIHSWFDETKSWFSEMQHRSMRHHSEGIFECEKVFGQTFTNSDGKIVYTRYVGEQHINEDLGFIPSASDWLECFSLEMWMMNRSRKLKAMAERPAYPDNLPRSLQPVDLPDDVGGILRTPMPIENIEFRPNNQKEIN